ncbi:MAG TPA: phosphoribosylformylglycinamidine cyclo-ligase [Thermoplasmata archaeon]|nr:phosphoribosylformylglycinamidine cyclo-ligase [Thermoplasmata archaeon]
MNAPSAKTAWTYARAGVDRVPVGASLRSLLAEVRYRPPPTSGRRLPDAGHYAGLLRLGRETIAVTTDTVGTKSLLARELGRWEEVGEDLVAVNVNDLAAVGARPAGLVDCLSVPVAEPEVFAALGRGIDRGLRAAQCHLLGGETAVVPEIVQGPDLGGTAVGFFPRGRAPVLGTSIRPGDQLVGIPSSGIHANGFTLVRRLVVETGAALDRPRPGSDEPLGQELLRPTRIYVGLSEAVARGPDVSGLAHISGGGVRNLVRLNAKVEFVLDAMPAAPALFDFLQRSGDVAADEMYQTFNMGIGFVLVVRPRRTSELMRRLRRAGAPDARVIGHVTRGRGVSLPQLGLRYEGYS